MFGVMSANQTSQCNQILTEADHVVICETSRSYGNVSSIWCTAMIVRWRALEQIRMLPPLPQLSPTSAAWLKTMRSGLLFGHWDVNR